METGEQFRLLCYKCGITVGEGALGTLGKPLCTVCEEIYGKGTKTSETMEKPGGSCPSQYGLPENSTDLQDLIEHRQMNFAIGSVFKACYRRGTCSHSDELRDARKMKWFAQREIDRLEKLNQEAIK